MNMRQLVVYETAKVRKQFPSTGELSSNTFIFLVQFIGKVHACTNSQDDLFNSLELFITQPALLHFPPSSVGSIYGFIANFSATYFHH